MVNPILRKGAEEARNQLPDDTLLRKLFEDANFAAFVVDDLWSMLGTAPRAAHDPAVPPRAVPHIRVGPRYWTRTTTRAADQCFSSP